MHSLRSQKVTAKLKHEYPFSKRESNWRTGFLKVAWKTKDLSISSANDCGWVRNFLSPFQNWLHWALKCYPKMQGGEVPGNTRSWAFKVRMWKSEVRCGSEMLEAHLTSHSTSWHFFWNSNLFHLLITFYHVNLTIWDSEFSQFWNCKML